jgi:hypothetical protein
MAIWGADVAQLRNLGSKLQAGAAEIENQKSLLQRVLSDTQWEGPDAIAFRGEWNGQHMSSLTHVAEALKEAGQKAGRNADEQDNASR